MRAPALLLPLLSIALLAGCGGAGPYGFARTYAPLGVEAPYLQRMVDLTYDDVRRFPDRYGEDLVGWFGVVTRIESVNEETGEARVYLNLRAHQERHLCGNETGGSCRVTVSRRDLGPFVALLTIRPEDAARTRYRMNAGGSLLRVYGRVLEGGDEETGPVLQTEYYRHWPVGTWVDTGASGGMRR